MITLDPTTWEFASKMDNFSGWVRSKLMEEMAKTAKAKEFKFESYCVRCDLWYKHTSAYDAKYNSCQECDRMCDYMTAEVTE
mgnify:FL=1